MDGFLSKSKCIWIQQNIYLKKKIPKIFYAFIILLLKLINLFAYEKSEFLQLIIAFCISSYNKLLIY